MREEPDSEYTLRASGTNCGRGRSAPGDAPPSSAIRSRAGPRRQRAGGHRREPVRVTRLHRQAGMAVGSTGLRLSDSRDERTQRAVSSPRSVSTVTVHTSASRVLNSTMPGRPTCAAGSGLAFQSVPSSGAPSGTGSVSPSSSGVVAETIAEQGERARKGRRRRGLGGPKSIERPYETAQLRDVLIGGGLPRASCVDRYKD